MDFKRIALMATTWSLFLLTPVASLAGFAAAIEGRVPPEPFGRWADGINGLITLLLFLFALWLKRRYSLPSPPIAPASDHHIAPEYIVVVFLVIFCLLPFGSGLMIQAAQLDITRVWLEWLAESIPIWWDWLAESIRIWWEWLIGHFGG